MTAVQGGSVLRLYGPEECDDATFVVGRGPRPLDWERCRTCEGTTWATMEGRPPKLGERHYACPTCGGHGSLRAAALAFLMGPGARDQNHPLFNTGNPPSPRCEGCGHPMSDGTWEGVHGADRELRKGDAAHVAACLRGGREATDGELGSVHWSPCDEGCRHADPVRCPDGGTCHHECASFQPGGYALGECWRTYNAGPLSAYSEAWPRPKPKREASWRQVEVRTLGWAHDLRPERLAVLCLRCWAARP